MKVTVIKSKSHKRRIAEKCIEQELHTWGSMYSWYHFPNNIEAIAVVRESKDIVGVAVQLYKPDVSYDIGVYVKPQHRRKKIGTALVKALNKQWPGKKYSYYNLGDGRKFFPKVLKY